MWAFEQMPSAWVVGFWGDEGATPRAAPRLTGARELWFRPNRITSTFNSWIYIEWVTQIWIVSGSPFAYSAPLKGALHHAEHRAIKFIGIAFK